MAGLPEIAGLIAAVTGIAPAAAAAGLADGTGLDVGDIAAEAEGDGEGLTTLAACAMDDTAKSDDKITAQER